MEFQEFKKKFPSKKVVISHFVKLRYEQGIKCSHCDCKGDQIYQRIDLPKMFECKSCGNSFSVFAGTIFEKSSTDLKKWLYAIHLFLNNEKVISALQLQREIGTSYKTAWRMLHQIRLAVEDQKKNKRYHDSSKAHFMKIMIEISEIYLGTRTANTQSR